MDGTDIEAKFDIHSVGAVNRRNGRQSLTFGSLPTQSSWKTGDMVYNKDPGKQLGVAGSWYLLVGWTRSTNGTTNALHVDWYENRVPTGN